jgi:hypothetical protein
MAYRLVASLLAEGVALDRITGRMTAFNMLESVLAPAFPAALAKLAVVNVYEVDGEREERFERVSVQDGDGSILAQTTAELRGEGIVHRSAHLFQGVSFPRPGTYVVVTEGAPSASGPWQRVSSRRLHALERPHPLAAGKAELREATHLTE